MIAVTPSKIVCVGRNYVAHARELGNELPERPMLFFKPPSALIGPGEAIELPGASAQVEYEGEIGVVIGTRLRRADARTAEAGIRGYICANDVTARDLQKPDGQWGRAKGFDTFCPVGPRVVEGLDWRALSVVMTLEPGDLVLTGTPAGVGRLAAGDTVEVEIPGVGTISNPVRREGPR